MPTVVSCECGQSFQAADWLAGREVPCPSCGQTLSVPGPSADAAEPAAKAPATKAPAAAASADKIVVACKCGKRFQAGAKLLGKVVKCPGCGNPLKVQRAAANAGAAKSAAAKPAAARPAPAKPAPSANTDPLGMDLSTFDSAAFDQAGMGGGLDQGGFGTGGLGAVDLGQGGFGTGGFDQAGFDQGGLGQAGFDQGGLGAPLDNLSMGYGQPQAMGGNAGAQGYPGGQPQQESSGGGSFELSPKMLVILMSIAGGSVVLLLLAIFVPPVVRYFMTPSEVAVAPAPVVAAPPVDTTPLNWVPFTSPSGEYSADFPGSPATTATTPNSFETLPGVDSPASVYLPTRGQFSVGRVALPQVIEQPEVRQAWVKTATDAEVNKNSGNIVVSRKEIMAGTNPGMEVRIEGKNQTRDYDSLCHIIMTKTHLYFVSYAAPKGQFNQEDANHFLGSFKLTAAN